MSHPVVQAERSAKKWGGTQELYLPVHLWLDATKGHLADHRHRMLLHNTFGVLLAEQVFGTTLTIDAERRVFVRDVALQHIVEDLGWVPTVAECLAELPLAAWMGGGRKLVSKASVRDLAGAAYE
jgi:hypothetical protein